MSTIAQPQPTTPIVQRPFDQRQRQAILETLEDLHNRLCETPTQSTTKKSFPSYNLFVELDAAGGIDFGASPKRDFRSDACSRLLFIGSNPVELGSDRSMTFAVAHNGQIGGRLCFPAATLRKIATPTNFVNAPVALNHIDDTQIIQLLHISVQEGRPLSVLPRRFEGPLPSDNPLLQVGDLILEVVYNDLRGGVLCTIEDRIIERYVV